MRFVFYLTLVFLISCKDSQRYSSQQKEDTEETKSSSTCYSNVRTGQTKIITNCGILESENIKYKPTVFNPKSTCSIIFNSSKINELQFLVEFYKYHEAESIDPQVLLLLNLNNSKVENYVFYDLAEYIDIGLFQVNKMKPGHYLGLSLNPKNDEMSLNLRDYLKDLTINSDSQKFVEISMEEAAKLSALDNFSPLTESHYINHLETTMDIVCK